MLLCSIMTLLCWSFLFFLFWWVVRKNLYDMQNVIQNPEIYIIHFWDLISLRYCDGSFCTHSNFCSGVHQTKFKPTQVCSQPCMYPYFQPPSNWLWLFLHLKRLTKVAMKRNLKVSSTSNFQLSKIKTTPFFNFRHNNKNFEKADHRFAKGLTINF